MVKHSVIAIIAVAFLASAAAAETVQLSQLTLKFDVAVGTGVNADYDAATGILTWSAGASGYLMDTVGNTYLDSDITVTGLFSNAIDTSVGGQAMANFQLDSVTLTFNSIEFPSVTGATSKAILEISRYGSNRYWESEIAADADVLHGQALVGVTASFLLEPVWGASHDVIWDGINDVSCLDSMTSLPFGANFQDYLHSYSSDNNTIVLNADESTYVVPEPCTLAILGLGAILFRRRMA
jgi:hypothetical protein